MKEDKDKFPFEERKVADNVADEILTVNKDDESRKYFWLILLFLICLIFLVASISFAVFDTYYDGGKKNLIDVGVDVVIDDNGDNDNPSDNKKPSNGDNNTGNKKPSDSTPSNNNPTPVRPIDPTIGSVLFSFNEGSNYINMNNVLPTSDAVGKKLTGDKEYFDFSVSAKIKKKRGSIVYEISLVPIAGNTIKQSDVRVNLTENGKEVSVLDSEVNNFSSLPNSSYRKGAKVIYRNVVNSKFSGDYVFRMWLSSKANIGSKPLSFACKVVVDAYYR